MAYRSAVLDSKISFTFNCIILFKNRNGSVVEPWNNIVYFSYYDRHDA